MSFQSSTLLKDENSSLVDTSKPIDSCQDSDGVEESSTEIIVNRHDFDCPLCFALLFDPITLECGHTFCRDCMIRCFEFKKHCPYCSYHCGNMDALTHNKNVLLLIEIHLPWMFHHFL